MGKVWPDQSHHGHHTLLSGQHLPSSKATFSSSIGLETCGWPAEQANRVAVRVNSGRKGLIVAWFVPPRTC